jgi:Transposase DDE domain
MAPPAATSCRSIWPSPRDAGPGCARQNSGSTGSALSALSRSRKGASSACGFCQRRLVEDWRAERFANREYEAHWERGVLERGRKQMGSGPRPYAPPARPEGELNTTDPDAKRMKSGRTFMPAYNAQAVTTEQQIVIAAELTSEGVDFEQLEPMIATAEQELRRAGVKEKPGVVLADAGYWSNGHIDSLRERGIVPIVAPDTPGKGPRKTRLGGPYDFMRRVIATKQGGALYTQRQWMVEPVFAQIKTNRRIDRFKRRGLAAARSEWRLIAATHNLLKLHRHTLQAAGA